MIRGLYSAASALDAATANQELVSENLANANVPGYRRSGMLFEALQPAGPADASNARLGGTRAAGTYTSFEPGPIQYTGNPLDLSLTSNVYFVLDGPNGPLYTRNGSFQRTADGQLQGRSGMPVRSTGGRINIPPTASQISVSKDGIVEADGVELGRLQLAQFTDPSALQRAGTTLFEGPPPQTPDPGTFKVEQGYREGSNVQIVNEMVGMLTGMRLYEAAQRAMKSIGDAVSLTTKPQ